ncbi:MAG TPA: alpha/beta hydrolase [Terriglobales bacterium]|jgi:acetyl esterase/lipase|nr:alpha/beta hydrolase [Terriglobales bacterium]
MKPYFRALPFFCTLLATVAFAAEPKVIPLWPGVAPGSENSKYEETQITVQDGTKRISNVTHPTLTAFLPDAATANGTAVIICPGGGFRWLSFDHEGAELARWLNSIGVTAFVLKYRVMRTGDEDEKDPAKAAERKKAVIPLAIADGQQAVRLVRAHASEWSIARDRIVLLGFSAGGYVAAGATVQHDAESRPNFAAFLYPGTPDDLTAPADAPPLFMVQADDDKTVPPLEHSIHLYEAWKKAGISAELHIYSRGGHGFGMHKKGLPVDTWPDRFRDWLDLQGLLKPAH